jgi:outer membrane protein OmpA-like peptidoglycan-associated protein
MKILKYIICLLLVNNLYSKEYINLNLTGGIGVNYNIYLSNFTELNGYKSCCSNYDFAFGVGDYFFLGLEKNYILFDLNDEKLGILLNYNNFSANYKINEYIGNDLQDNSYRKIFVDNLLDVNYKVLSLSPFYQFQLLKDLPLNFKFALSLGIPIEQSFSQKEVLVSPKDLNFKNGTKENYNYSGKIPDINSFYFGSDLGLNYKIYETENLSLSLEIAYSLGFLPIVKNYDWNTMSAKSGIRFNYKFPAPEPDREKFIPMPEPIMPIEIEKPEPPIISLKVIDNQKEYQNNDTITAVFDIQKFHYFISNLPILFFKKGELEPEKSLLVSNNLDNNFLEILKDNDFALNYPLLIKEFVERENLKFDIIAYSSDEDISILEKRIRNVIYKLNEIGLNTSETKVITKKTNLGKEKREELINETRRIEFKFSNKKNLITNKITKEKVDYRFNKSIAVLPLVKSESNDLKFYGYTTFNNSDKNIIELKTNDILLSASLFETHNNSPNNLFIYAEIEDSYGQKSSSEFNLFLNNRKILKEEFYNLTDENNSSLILGYFDFDGTNFNVIDNNVLFYLKNLINNDNYQIEIIPSTDNLGSKEYNQELAIKRGRAAINLLKLNINKLPKNISIRYLDKEIFNNNSPYGRSMNRSVIVNVKKLK